MYCLSICINDENIFKVFYTYSTKQVLVEECLRLWEEHYLVKGNQPHFLKGSKYGQF